MESLQENYIEACARGERDSCGPALTSYFDQALISFYHRSREQLPQSFTPTGRCIPGQRRLHVRPDGYLQPCERVGDTVFIGDLENGISAGAVAEITDGLFAAVGARCQDCWALRLCTICYSALAPNWKQGSSPQAEVSSNHCQAVKNRLKWTFRLYLSLLDRSPDALNFLRNTSVF
jgi:uncharacterized protein